RSCTTPSWASSTPSFPTPTAGPSRCRGAAMPDCVFCRIRDGQIPSAKVYEDAKTIAFMDINPLTRGHCLVATKQHAANIYEADVEDLKAVMATAKKVAGAIRKTLAPDGVNRLQANGAAAIPAVPHFHLHLVPRCAREWR